MMGIYRNSKTLQKRGGGGRFERWNLDRDFGVTACPHCRTLSAVRPEQVGPFIDPVAFNARVCSRCGWDSRRPDVVPEYAPVATPPGDVQVGLFEETKAR